MTKSDCLKALMLLSAVESLLLAEKRTIPPYLHDTLHEVMDALREAVLK